MANDWEGKTVTVPDESGELHEATVVQLPFYDAEKKISRGLDTNIPEKP